MIRLVVSDVDGTILDETEKLPDRITELAELIRQKQIMFTIASGRDYSQLETLINMLNIQAPIVACNGTAIWHKNSFSWYESIAGNILREMISRADAFGMTVVLSMPDGEYAYRKTSFVEQTIEKYGRFGNILKLSDNDWDKVSVQKVLIIGTKHHREHSEILKLLQKYENSLTWVDFGDSFDIVPKGCTKASGVSRISKELGILPSEIMALGDSYNDIEMLSNAGIGVAVNNAVEDLKECADYICRGKYIAGVIEAIQKFC